MAIRLVPDVGAPLAVTAVDLITETTAPDWNEWAAYIMAAGGYLGSFTGWGGDMVKNVGIASFPWAAKKIYERVRGGAGAGHRLAFRAPVSRSSVSRYPAPATKSPFEGTRLV